MMPKEMVGFIEDDLTRVEAAIAKHLAIRGEFHFGRRTVCVVEWRQAYPHLSS